MSAPDLKSRIALITGAAGGIGQALARAFVDAGMRVALCDTSKDGLLRLHRELGPDRTIALPLDVSDAAACRDSVAHTVAHFGRLDVLVNNAAVGMSTVREDHMRRVVQIEDIAPELWARFMAVNLSGPFYMAHAAVPGMRARKFGRIINVTTSFFTMLNPGFCALRPGQVRPGSLEQEPGRGIERHRHHRQRRGARRAHRHADGAGRRHNGTQPVDPPGEDGAAHAASRVRCRRCRHRHALRRGEVGLLACRRRCHGRFGSAGRLARPCPKPGVAGRRPQALIGPCALRRLSLVEDAPLTIDYEKRDGVAYITLNNPSKANILDKQTSDAISEAWIDLWEDRSIRCAILTGKGDTHFCGGHNLAPRENITEEEREYLRTQRIFWPLAGTVHGQKTGVDGRMGDHYPRVWKPVIAAVNGWAAGAGLYILLSSTDIRIASAEHARFKFALLTQGWLGHGPGASLLAKQLRYIDAMKILLTDEPFDAQEALRIGLINEVVPHAQLLERAEKIARHICTLPPAAVRMMKEFVVRFGDLPTDQAWHVQNLINSLLIQATTDGEEGRQAFNEKRKPKFDGKLRKRGDAWPDLSEEDAKRLDEAYRSGEF